VVTQYSFGSSNHRIEAEGFDPTYHHTSFSAGVAGVVMRHMNWIMKIMNILPESVSVKLSPEMASFVILRRVGFLLILNIA
jgi:hypothetical protein